MTDTNAMEVETNHAQAQAELDARIAEARARLDEFAHDLAVIEEEGFV